MDGSAGQVASAFIHRYERAWNNKEAEDVSKLYAPDGVLVGYVIATGRAAIQKLLQGIRDRGWTNITIKIVSARKVGNVVLIANEYTAIGTGESVGKTLDAKSSHVLVCIDGEWLSTLHTAT